MWRVRVVGLSNFVPLILAITVTSYMYVSTSRLLKPPAFLLQHYWYFVRGNSPHKEKANDADNVPMQRCHHGHRPIHKFPTAFCTGWSVSFCYAFSRVFTWLSRFRLWLIMASWHHIASYWYSMFMQTLAWRPMAPNQYLNQFWLTTNRENHEEYKPSIFCEDIAIFPRMYFKIVPELKITAIYPVINGLIHSEIWFGRRALNKLMHVSVTAVTRFQGRPHGSFWVWTQPMKGDVAL